MKNRIWKAAALRIGCLLLFLGVSAVLLGAAFAGLQIAPKESGLRESFEPEGMSAESAAYWMKVDLDPTVLYDRACQQVVFLSWESREGKLTSGSGIIITADGYILTNAHCVSDAQSEGITVKVELYTGVEYDAEIVGCDQMTDVALLKIHAQGLRAATLGDSSKLKACQTVYAMGHPDLELKYTMTSGIISGVDRVIAFSDGTMLHMFQLDAAVNPGNSGGPVYDTTGCVVGLITAKYVNLTTEGLGFAIPINDATAIAAELKEHGYVTGRPLMGITIQSVAANLICEGSPAGAMIYSVEPDLPGDRAGLQRNDIIVGINGHTVASMEDLTEAKNEYRAFDTVTVRFWRGGDFMETKLTFDEVTPEHPVGNVIIMPEDEEAADDDANEEAQEPEEEAPEEAPETLPGESEAPEEVPAEPRMEN